jgi:chemotaxis protein CheX
MTNERKLMQAEVSAEILVQIVQSVFVTMMGVDLSTCDMPWDHSGSRMTSTVYLAGDWNGAVMLECSPQQACQFAGLMLSIDTPKTVDDDVYDVLGELANVIGGNMKSGMSMGISLSMPSVMIGRDYAVRICGSEVKKRLAFQCDYGPFWVTVLAIKK